MRSPEGDLNRPCPSQKVPHPEAEAAMNRQSSGQYPQQAAAGGVGIAGVLQKRWAQERKNETFCNSQHQGFYTEIWRRRGQWRPEGYKVDPESIDCVCALTKST